MIQLLWSATLALHAVLALGWWWIMPGGFPSSAPEFWVHQVGPFVPIGLFAATLVVRGALAEALLAPLFVGFPLFWIAFALSLRLTFPISIGASWNLPLLLGCGLAALWVRQFRPGALKRVPVLLAAGAALWAGWAVPVTFRAAEPATHPAETALPPASGAAPDGRLVKLSREAQLHPGEGRVVLKNDRVVLAVQPLLTFADRSPDRSWTSLAEPDDRRRTERKLVATQRGPGRATLEYRDEDRSVVSVAAQGGTVEIDARSSLPAPVFSHANSWAEVTLRGHRRLSVVFSPAPGRRVEVPPPSAPARYAYLDAAGGFHVVQAAAQRHGPFTELAAGRLERGQPLEVAIYDGDAVVFRVTLRDFTAQASTQASPAAGWGVPENGIELVRGGDPEDAPALLAFSLASTSIGRSARSVGHAPGVYRDRITISIPR